MSEKPKQITINLLELIWIFLSTSVLIGVITLIFNLYSPLLVITLTLIILILILLIFRIEITVSESKIDWIIIAILFFSLLIRIAPWIYLEGGQDQGVYIAMSKQYELSKGLEFNDNVYQELPNFLKEYYGKDRGGWFALGFNRQSDGDIYTNFYPAHPIMLSLAGFVLGNENRAYALTIFAILSILMAYLLTVEITGSKKAGYLAAVLISISPLHLYFSKFPVTEIMTLALNLGAIYYLIKAKNSGNYLNLILNLILVNVTLYTRLTWLISLPVYVLSVLVILAFENDRKGYKVWIAYLTSLLVSFLLSVFFYYSEIPFLYKNFLRDIFDYIPAKAFYGLIILTPLIIYILTSYFRRQTQIILELVYKYRVIIFYVLLFVLLFVSANAFYKMVFTDRYLGTRYDYFWGMARGGWIVLKDMALSSLLIYVTPFGLLGLIFSAHKLKNPHGALLMLLLLSYTFFHFFIVKYTPYHFYYARYQLSEIVPLLLIFVSLVAMEFFNKKRWLSILIIIPIVAYSLIYIPFIILQGHIGVKPEIFNNISKEISSDDIVMYYNPIDWSSNFFFSPLKYFYNFKAIKVESLDEVSLYGESIPNTYILSTVALEGENFRYINKFKFEKGFLTNAKEDKPPLVNEIRDWKIPFCDSIFPEKFCSGAIPIKYHKASIDIYLYNYIDKN